MVFIYIESSKKDSTLQTHVSYIVIKWPPPTPPLWRDMTPTHAIAAIAPSTAEPRFSANIYLIIQNNKILFERCLRFYY